jgi:hypothetical protein
MEESRKFVLALASVLLATTANAEPFMTSTAAGTAYVYNTTATGGTASVTFTMPSPPAGDYMVSFTANFTPQGTTSAPVGFSCLLLRDNANVAQATAFSFGPGGWDIGVDGQGVMKIFKETKVTAICGTISGSWTWAGRPLEITFTKLFAVKSGSLANSPEAAVSHVGITR